VLYGGGLVCLIIGACYVTNYPSKEFWPQFLLLSFYIFAALSVVIVVITLLSKTKENTSLPSLMETNAGLGHKTGGVWIRWALLALVMGVIYIIFR
jgi:SSS family solute:Na+ symporter